MSKSLPLYARKYALRWADLAVFPLVLGLSILPLLWFGRHWTVAVDPSRYLLLGWNLISSGSYTSFGDTVYTVRGPIFPELLGGLMLLFGRDVESLAWVIRLLALANPVLVYFLLKRIAGPAAGLLAAAMVTFLGYTATFDEALTIDAVHLTVYLAAVLALLTAAQRDSAGLAAILSGLLLGLAILTKETSLAAVPLALFAALLLGWNLRGMLSHYAGVVVICLPWWMTVWVVSGEIYLPDRLPSWLVVLAVAALALPTILVVVSYRRSGAVARLLADERRRRRIGWLVVLAPPVVLSLLLLNASGGPSSGGENSLLGYVTVQLGEELRLLYLLPFAGAYVLWEVIRGDRLWGFYAALLVLQIPASLIVLHEQWATRQWLIAQTLLFGALAGLIAKLLGAAIRMEGRGLYRSVAFGAAAVLIVALVLASVSQIRYLLDDDYVTDANGETFLLRDYHTNEVNPSVRDMHDWMATNLPEGESVLTTPHYSKQLAFLDGARREWEVLRTDSCQMTPSPDRCWPDEERPAVWFEMDANCGFRALSAGGLGQQLQRSGSEYILTTQEEQIRYPANLAWAPFLQDGDAFETVHQSYLPDARGAQSSYGLVLLKWTGEVPVPAPTQMSAESVKALIACERSIRGEGGYAGRIRGAFRNGIEVVGDRQETESARRAVESIYAKASAG